MAAVDKSQAGKEGHITPRRQPPGLDQPQERYFNLFRQQCLSNIDKNEDGCREISAVSGIIHSFMFESLEKKARNIIADDVSFHAEHSFHKRQGAVLPSSSKA